MSTLPEFSPKAPRQPAAKDTDAKRDAGAEQAKAAAPRAEAIKTQRRRRSSEYTGIYYRLSTPAAFKDPEYRYYWANDVPGRLEALTLHDDWSFVTAGSDGTPVETTSATTAISREAGYDASRNPIRAYLLRKRKDWCEEDEAKQLEAMDSRYARMTEQGHPGGEGTLTGSHAYRPDELKHAYRQIRRG